MAAATSGTAYTRAIALPRITYRQRLRSTHWIAPDLTTYFSSGWAFGLSGCQLFNRCRTLDTRAATLNLDPDAASAIR